MVCIYCRYETKVTNSRHNKKLNFVWRRRQCLSCGSVFTTLEKPDLYSSLSVNQQSLYQPFSRDKLFISLYDSIKHRKSALTDSTALTDTVISKLNTKIQNACLTPEQIAKTAYAVLKQFDKAAATYYAAYHTGAEDRN